MDVGTNLKIETLIGKILAWNFYVIRTVVSGCNKIIRWLVLIFCPKIYFRDHTIVYINIFSYGIQPALYSLTWFSPDFTITSIVSLAFCRQFYGYRLFYEKTLMHTSQASCMVLSAKFLSFAINKIAFHMINIRVTVMAFIQTD